MMAEHITYAAVQDDCFRLMLVSNDTCDDFDAISYTQPESALLGAITAGNELQMVDLLESLRDRWPQRQPEEHLEQKIAFILGWLCHRAVERQLAAFYATLPAEDVAACAIYHDVFLLREIYAGGRNAPFNPFLLAPEEHPAVAGAALDVASLEQLTQVLVQRALLALHHLTPAEQNVEGWLDGLLALRQRYVVNLRLYSQVFAQPDPAQVRRYITESNFYAASDPHIRVARAVQQRDELRVSYVSQALQATPTSHYGLTLKRGYDSLLAASNFFTHKITRAELLTHLEL
jgi:hypothetical protein